MASPLPSPPGIIIYQVLGALQGPLDDHTASTSYSYSYPNYMIVIL